MLINLTKCALRYGPENIIVNIEASYDWAKELLTIEMECYTNGNTPTEMERLADIFGKFSDLDESNLEEIGIGLLASTYIIDANEGTIFVPSENKPGHTGLVLTMHMDVPSPEQV